MNKNLFFTITGVFTLIACSYHRVSELYPPIGQNADYYVRFEKFVNIPQNQNVHPTELILSYQNLPVTKFSGNLPSEGIISCRALISKTGDIKDILLLYKTNTILDSLVINTISHAKFKPAKNTTGVYMPYTVIIAYPFCNHKFGSPLLNGEPIFMILNSLSGCNDRADVENAKPEILHKTWPAYPIEARKSRIQGRVVVTVKVNKQGFVEYARPAKSIATSLDNAAVDAAMLLRLKPAVSRWKKVKILMKVPYDFFVN